MIYVEDVCVSFIVLGLVDISLGDALNNIINTGQIQDLLRGRSA